MRPQAKPRTKPPAKSPAKPHRRRRGRLAETAAAGGFSLLETVATMGIAAVAVLGAASGLRAIAVSVELDSARRILVAALYDARREAYAEMASVTVSCERGSRELSVFRSANDARQIALPAGVSISSGPDDGGISFYPSGLADNATVVLSASPPAPGRAPQEARVVVNQRSLVR